MMLPFGADFVVLHVEWRDACNARERYKNVKCIYTTYSFGARSDENSQWKTRTARLLEATAVWHDVDAATSGVSSSETTSSFVQIFLAPWAKPPQILY